MNRSMNSTQMLNKIFSRVKMSQHNSINSISRSSPQPNTFSSRQKTKSTIDTLLNQSLISKNKKLALMIKTVNSYMINIEEIDWIMRETETIMKNYMKNTMEKAGPAHKIQIQNLYNEIVKLISRFGGIDKKWVYEMTIPLKQKKFVNNNLIGMNNTENFNMMNFKKTETIGSFKCTDTENQQQNISIHTDFSKIKLPAVIKQSQFEQNQQTNREQHNYNTEIKLKQTQAALQVIKRQLQNQKKQKSIQKQRYEQRIKDLNKKIDMCHSQWQIYKNYAKNSIKKCKLHLNQLMSSNSLVPNLFTQNQDPEDQATNRNNNKMYDQYMNNPLHNEGASLIKKKVEDFLDELFIIENKLDRKILDNKLEDIDIEKQQKIKQLINLQVQIKKKKAESDRFQTQRIKYNQSSNNINGSSNNINKNQNSRIFGEEADLARLLYVQATTIQHLL